MTDQTLRGPLYVVQAYAKSNLFNNLDGSFVNLIPPETLPPSQIATNFSYLIGVFGIYVILDCNYALF